MTTPSNIFFHVGISKTGSTFLQNSIFPKLQNITYLPTNRFKKYKTLVQQSSASNILLSREFDRQMEREVKKWAADFPHTKTILVLRRQDAWVASQYRRFIKNGFGFSFQEFLDLENDTGYWERDNLFFANYINILTRYFETPPLVLFYEDLRKEPLVFIQKIAEFTNATFDPLALDLTKVHASYNEKQLKIMRKAGKYLNIAEMKPYKSSLLNTIRRYAYVYPLRYGVLYGSLLCPDFLVDKAPLISPAELKAVEQFYAKDWAAVREL